MLISYQYTFSSTFTEFGCNACNTLMTKMHHGTCTRYTVS